MKRPPHERITFREAKPWLLLGLATVICAGVGYLSWKRQQRAAPRLPDSALTSDSVTPSLTPRAGLEMQTSIERVDRARRIRLSIGAGEAILTLGPADSASAGAKGEGTLTAENTTKGAAFLTAVASWFGEVPPAPRSSPASLVPLRVEYVRLGTPTSRAPEALRLTLVGARRKTEIFFNLFPDGARATFIERGRGEARPALFALLAEALRDGPKPPRSPATDPNLASDAPFATSTRPLLPSPVLAVACGQHDLYAVLPEGTRSKLVAVSPAGAPRTLTTFDGVVEGFVASPDGKKIAMLLVHALSADQVLPEDTRELRLVDVATGESTPLTTEDDGFRATGAPVFRPRGGMLAVEGRLPTTTPGDRLTRAYTLWPLALVGETDAHLRLRPARFAGDAVVVAATEYQPRPRRRPYLWTPGSAPAQNDAVPFASPDSRFSFTIDEEKIVLADGRVFTTTDLDDRAAIRELAGAQPTWLGPHVVALHSEIPLALDLSTAKLRPLVAQTGSTLVCATSDTKYAALTNADGTATVAELPSPNPQ